MTDHSTPPRSPLVALNERSREIFRRLVETYIASGEPVGSQHLANVIPLTLSSASIRNVMADLESMGLLYAPHTSAGRLPTERGLRFFVDALMEAGNITHEERHQIEAKIKASGHSQTIQQVLGEASHMLSGLSGGAGVVLASRGNPRLRHLEFVRLQPDRGLVILVAEDNSVENRVVEIPAGLPMSALTEATNFLNAHIQGRTISEARAALEAAMISSRNEIDQVSARLLEAGLASWSGGERDQQQLIVSGHAKLLEDLDTLADLERIRLLFDDLERKKEMIDLLGRADQAEGVQIYIGSENRLFSLSGSSLIIAPYRDSRQQVVGVLGVIGPTRLNYARIVPMVDYTARVISRMLG